MLGFWMNARGEPSRNQGVGKVGLLNAISEVFEIKCKCWISEFVMGLQGEVFDS